MTIDNFEKIKPLLRFDESKDNFYFIQIMQRRKDKGNEDIKHNNRIITNYYITSLEYLEDREEEIKALCEMFNARAYISANPCSFEKSCLYGMKEITDMVINKQYRSILNLLPTLAGKYPLGGENKLWVIDFDSKDMDHLAKVRETIKNSNGKEGMGVDKVKMVLPTKNGYHLITTAFDPRPFSELSKTFALPPNEIELGLHKASPTILYIA